MKCPLALLSIVAIVGVAWPSFAAITVLDYWRLGEDEPSPGPAVISTTTDPIGDHALTASGRPFYIGDVSVAAAGHTGSTLGFWNSPSVTATNGSYLHGAVISNLADNFGIECWVNPDTASGNRCIVYNGDTGGNGWGLYQEGANYAVLYGGQNFVGSSHITTNAWTHLAFVVNEGVTTFYVNGVPVTTSHAYFPNPPAGEFGIGAPPPLYASEWFSGRIDEVRVFTFGEGQFTTNDLLINSYHYKAAATNLLEPAVAGGDSVELIVKPAGGPWTASAGTAWLHVPQSNGINSAIVTFSFDSNLGINPRTGTINLSGQVVTVTQGGTNHVAAAPFTLLSNGFVNPSGIAADAAGDLYFTDRFLNCVKEWNASNQSLSTLIYSGLNGPAGVDVDAYGNLYFCDSGTNVNVWNAASHIVTTLISTSPFNPPDDLAVDAAGNIYVAEHIGILHEWVATNATLNPTGILSPPGVTIDALGNVYATSEFKPTFPYLYELTPTNGSVTLLVSNGLTTPQGVTVDASGNVFLTDNGLVKEWTPSSQSVRTLFDSGGAIYANGIAVDGADNLYFIDTIASRIMELPRAFVDATPRFENGFAGSDSLPPILASNSSHLDPPQPTSDQSWLTITGITNGVVSFAFTTNPGTTTRIAHITVLGVSVSINQTVPLTRPLLTNLLRSTGGSFQFSFTNNPNATTFNVLATTNLALPLSQWTIIGQPTHKSGMLFEFVDTSPGNASRFYAVVSP
jgi:sugar lactone lactonase YvrE